MNDQLEDLDKGRYGPWMQTSRGERFFPLDPRVEEVFIEDIANGLAQCGRYNGQRLLDKYYSVAEHSVLMTEYADRQKWPAVALLACLLHDAPEAYLNDMNRATKQAMREIAAMQYGGGVSHYDAMTNKVERVIQTEFEIAPIAILWGKEIKDLDQRIVPLEKAAVMAPAKYPWAFDKFEPLEGVEIQCWDAKTAYSKFLTAYYALQLRRNQERKEDFNG
jgi:hypothetical protein